MNGLPSDIIEDFAVDGMGNAWVLARDGRVARLSTDRWEQFELPASGEKSGTHLPDTTYSLDPGIRFLTEARAERGGSVGISITTDASGACVLCRSDAIYRYTAAGWQVTGLPRNVRPTVLTVTAAGEFWLGTESSGLFIRRQGGWVNLDSTRGLSGDDVESIIQDSSGRIWVGTRDGGITICHYVR
jgi:ligand-binding sensor domain-containing protein